MVQETEYLKNAFPLGRKNICNHIKPNNYSVPFQVSQNLLSEVAISLRLMVGPALRQGLLRAVVESRMTCTVEMEVGTNGLRVALAVLFQAAICGWHGFLQALDSISHVARFALAPPSILQGKGRQGGREASRPPSHPREEGLQAFNTGGQKAKGRRISQHKAK